MPATFAADWPGHLALPVVVVLVIPVWLVVEPVQLAQTASAARAWLVALVISAPPLRAPISILFA